MKKIANPAAAALCSGSPRGQTFQQHLKHSSGNDDRTAPSDHIMANEQGWVGSRTDIRPDFSLDHYQEQYEDNLLRKMINLPGLARKGTAKIQDLLQRSCAQGCWNNQGTEEWLKHTCCSQAKAAILSTSGLCHSDTRLHLGACSALSFHRKGSRPATNTNPVLLKV